MRIKLFVALVGLFLIVGCSNTTSNVRVVSNANKFCDNDIGYCLEAAETFWGKGAWQKSVGMSGQIVDHFTSNDVSVGSPEFTLIEVYHSPPSCEPEVLGYPDIIEGKTADYGTKTVWGKVYDDRGMGNTPSLEALCHYPPSPPGCSSIGENCDDGAGAYAFCSENIGNPFTDSDDKRVVICISQQTDNEKQAEEIFKSFRWTE